MSECLVHLKCCCGAEIDIEESGFSGVSISGQLKAWQQMHDKCNAAFAEAQKGKMKISYNIPTSTVSIDISPAELQELKHDVRANIRTIFEDIISLVKSHVPTCSNAKEFPAGNTMEAQHEGKSL